MKTIREDARETPIIRDVDVVVAGSGVSGLFAALGAAGQGARTLLVDRFGQLGGNMGPGGFIASTFGPEAGRTHHVVDYPGVCREFVCRLEKKLVPGLYGPPATDATTSFEYPSFSSAISWLALEMVRESGIELMLSAYAAAPFLTRNTVRGVFLETKSGRVAVQSTVLIDATGDASLAERAGVPVCHASASPEQGRKLHMWSGWVRPEFPSWNDGGIAVIIGGVDRARYETFCSSPIRLGDTETRFRDELAAFHPSNWFPLSISPMRLRWISLRRERAEESLISIRDMWHYRKSCLPQQKITRIAFISITAFMKK